eukprot:m.516438 g.516438  ORF g.516438 m.516438 type:complete len:326 (+) comp57475_c0_seq5:522-1499(+)
MRGRTTGRPGPMRAAALSGRRAAFSVSRALAKFWQKSRRCVVCVVVFVFTKLRSLRASQSQPRAVGNQVLACWIVWVFSAYWTYVGIKSCDNTTGLTQLLKNVGHELNRVHIEWMVDYGTMLGIARSGSVIPFEFDTDITISHSDAERLAELKDTLLAKYGYALYREREFVFWKGFWLLVYMFKWDPYIDICFRVYDSSHWSYTDIYCNYPVQPAEIKAECIATESKYPTTVDELYYCQGFRIDNCACRAARDVYPVIKSTVTFDGEPLFTPQNVTALCEFCYGPTWHTPLPKGIKMALSLRWVQVVVGCAYALLAWLLVRRCRV